MTDLLFLDLLRGSHLLCLAVGMGAAFYFDLRSLHRIAQPITRADITELHRIHTIVSLACVGLWVTGLALIWVRTNFDLATFSPKLWAKVIVVTALTTNALMLNTLLIPALTRRIGHRLIGLPISTLLPMTFCAGVSLSCWLLALALGSSAVLKTAKWDVLIPVMLSGSALCISGVLFVIFGMRIALHRPGSTPSPI
jgi:hypothetical protein